MSSLWRSSERPEPLSFEAFVFFFTPRAMASYQFSGEELIIKKWFSPSPFLPSPKVGIYGFPLVWPSQTIWALIWGGIFIRRVQKTTCFSDKGQPQSGEDMFHVHKTRLRRCIS